MIDGVLDTWGGGQLLAFSGLDGPTDFDRGLVARVAYEGAGLDIKLPGTCRLVFDAAPTARPTDVRLAGDFFRAVTSQGAVRGAFLDTRHLLIEGPCRAADCSEAIAVVRGAGRVLVGPTSAVNPRLIGADLDAAIAARRRWLSAAAMPAGLPHAHRRLLAKCLSVMKTQVYTPAGRIRRRWTTADRWPHRRMFLWDSVFHAVGWRHVDAAVARDAVAAMLDVQREDGFVPHSNDPAWSSRLTQPPVLATGAMAVDAIAPDDAFLREVYGGIARMIEFDLANRDTDGGGLLEWAITDDVRCRCDESGLDNSPRFDCAVPLDAPDFNAFVAHEAELLATMAERIGRPDDARRWRALHRRLCDLINSRLWNEELGLYVDCIAASGQKTNIKAASSAFLPLLCGAPSPKQALRLAANLTDPGAFGTPLPVPTTSPSEPLYSKDMWRGPVWANINWLIAEGFDRCGLSEPAGMIRRRTLDEVSRWYERLGCVFEFYDDQCRLAPPELTRKGRCVRDSHPHMVLSDYGWTATLCADWLFRTK